jgi:hypothetical protein
MKVKRQKAGENLGGLVTSSLIKITTIGFSK